jgi:signal transduction histidine kinase/DNA-binding response OmpR family regulator
MTQSIRPSQRLTSPCSLPLWGVLLLIALAGFAGCTPDSSDPAAAPIALPLAGHLYQAATTPAETPADYAGLDGWLAQQQPVANISLLGGAYWLYAEFRHDGDAGDWVLNPSNTLIDTIEARLYAANGEIQTQASGYEMAHDYMLHYGKDLRLQPGQTYRLLVYFSSPYFASYPSFQLESKRTYQRRVVLENLLILGSLGALISLAIYNLFLFAVTQNASHAYYSLYLIAFSLGWAFVFHIPAEALDWHDLRLHYIPFFLLPVFNTLFYLKFLGLPQRFPRLAAASYLNLVLPLLLLPSCFFALNYAHLLATLAITFWLAIGLISGIACWRAGYRPARYFVLAFAVLCLSGAIILPGNAGLVPDLVDNSELITLLCGTLDGLLLALALGDQIRLLSEEKNLSLQRQAIAEAASRAKSDFLTSISHELRTPLNGILGFTQLLQKPGPDPLPPSHQDYLSSIYRCGDYLLTLINDLLDIPKIEAGHVALEPAVFHLHDFLAKLLDIFHIQAEAKQIAFQQHYAEELPDWVLGDEKRLRQVLTNLLANAVKYTQQGSVTLSVDYRDGWASFRIDDTGQGIAQQDLQRIFQPYERLEQHRCIEGSGLGLPITKQLVELMRGRIEVESIPAQGCSFRVSLPLPASLPPPEFADWTKQEAGEAEEDLSGRPIVGYCGGPYKILIVDDFPDTLQLFHAILAPLGFILETAADGKECQEKAGSFQPDLVLMDVFMPRIDGLEAIRSLRLLARTRTAKILAITANPVEAIRQACLEAGANEVIYKPLDRELLLRQVKTLLGLEWQYLDNAPPAAAETGTVNRILSVLIVDDSDLTRTLFKTLFSEIPAHIDDTGDGIQALRALYSQTYDLAFLDIQMPLLGGREILQQLRNKAPSQPHGVFIAFTAAPDAKRLQLLELGFDEVLAKPVTDTQLHDLIQRHSQRWSQAAEDEPPAPRSSNDISRDFYVQCLNRCANGNAALAGHLFPRLFQEIPEQVRLVEQQLQDGEFELAGRTAHQLRGALAFCGLVDLEYSIAQLETALAEQRHHDALQWFSALQQASDNFLSQQDTILRYTGIAGD